MGTVYSSGKEANWFAPSVCPNLLSVAVSTKELQLWLRNSRVGMITSQRSNWL